MPGAAPAEGATVSAVDSQPADPVLLRAAFGGDPGLFPLPSATTARDRWHRALALSGQGRYAAAHAELHRLRRTADPALRSLVSSTRGSLLRQLGHHRLATALDGAALAASDDAEAAADALIGLAADALGMGRLPMAQALLERAQHVAVAARSQVRLGWVRAETAMSAGTFDTAVRHAEAALLAAQKPLAAGVVSVRHRVKSQLVRAAALACAGDPRAAEAVREVDRDCCAHGLLPLRWAAAMLRGDESDARQFAAQIRSRGGQFA
jgi:tetratricopeptide (TPR) repeat protein